ncbi:MAG: glycoside hydrolase family 65 protein, partial [Clostridia bacterium]|nr:glycoside hydrolase family 65 protein [Clostridia bacterium]
GNRTELVFERFSSFADDHVYCQRVTVRPLNHSLPVAIGSGVELRTKTMGQIVTKTLSRAVSGDTVSARILSGEKYGFTAEVVARSRVTAGGKAVNGKPEDGKIPLIRFETPGGDGEVVLEKIVHVVTARDGDGACAAQIDGATYEGEYARHIAAYAPLFEVANVEIEGKDELDGALRFASYHSLISVCRNDSVHGVAAKGLTGEHYHQFVWWDSEVYQMPFFLYTNPSAAKNTLLYRYRTLSAAKKIAAEKGLAGARFAFCSSVTGEECVWSFCVQPFLQDHIVSDVMLAVFRYLDATDDGDFLRRYGLELLSECALYWLSRVTKTERGYEILHVTGTDEHHAEVDNDAYTNYCVSYALRRFSALAAGGKAERFGFTKEREQELAAVAEGIFLPVGEYGYIPQFDGYFSLADRMDQSENLSGLQMRYSGSYADSQIIKQPDVMLLYSYVDVGMDRSRYQENFDYYEKMCEMSSSLSYAPHAVCAAHLGRTRSFLEYLEKTVTIDLANLHGGVEEGVHSGCEAGGYLAVLYGAFGARFSAAEVSFDPRYLPGIKSVRQRFYYKNALILSEIRGKLFTIQKLKGDAVSVGYGGKTYLLTDSLTFELT